MSRAADAPFVLTGSDGHAGESNHPVTLYLTITASGIATSHPMLPTNTTNAIATEADISPMEQATEATIVHPQGPIESAPFLVAVANTTKPLPPPTDHISIETGTPTTHVPDVQASMSPTKDALLDADEATKAIDLTNTWEGAVERIKWVIDTVSPVAGVRHSAISFYLMFS